MGPDDEEQLVNDGFLKASARESTASPTLVPVGQSVDYKIAVRPQHYRFAAQHRVRLRISGGAKNTLVQPAAVDVKVQTEGSTLDLSGWD